MKPPDENDLHRAGALPVDPLVDAAPVRHAPMPPSPRWRSYGEILKATEEDPREWLVPDLIPFGSVTQIIGHAKRAGKSTFAWGLAAAAERGSPFLGLTLPRTGAVVLSEEGDHDAADKIRAFALDPSRGAVLSRGVLTGVPEWVALVRDGTALAVARGIRLLIVDTFAFWAALEGSSENDAGTVLAALRPLQEAADKGLAVLLIHHPSKAGGREGGLAGRGSSALPGAVEATIEIRFAGTEERPNRRLLHVESRTVGVRDLMVEMVKPDPATGRPARFDLVGDAVKVERAEVEAAVVQFLRDHPGEWFRRAAVAEGAGRRGGEVGKALPALVRAHKIACHGEGRPGSPYLYANLGTPPPVPEPLTVPALPDRSPGVPGNGPLAPSSTVPAVPPPSMKGGMGTVRDARGKESKPRRSGPESGNDEPGADERAAIQAEQHHEPAPDGSEAV